MANVFISYRHDDTKEFAHRMYQGLCQTIPAECIFFDREIPLGMDWDQHLQEQLASCSVLIALIGNSWSPAVAGRSRIREPRDRVKMELAAALQRGLPVIPILVDGAAMPRKQDLPRSLAALPKRQALVIDEDFDAAMEKLTQRVQPLLDAPPPLPAPTERESWEDDSESISHPWVPLMLGLVVILAIAVGWWQRHEVLTYISTISLRDPGATLLLSDINAWISWCVFGMGIAVLVALVMLGKSFSSGTEGGNAFEVLLGGLGAFLSVVGFKVVWMLFDQGAVWFGLLAGIFLAIVVLFTVALVFATPNGTIPKDLSRRSIEFAYVDVHGWRQAAQLERRENSSAASTTGIFEPERRLGECVPRSGRKDASTGTREA
jgi:TIR domain